MNILIEHSEKEREVEDKEEHRAPETDQLAFAFIASATVGLRSSEMHHQVSGDEEASDKPT